MFELDAPCRSILSVRTWAAGVAHPMEVVSFLCADGEVDFCLDAYAHVSESAAGLLQRTTTTSTLPLCVESEEGVDFKFSIAPPVMESTTANTTSRLLARLKKKNHPRNFHCHGG